VSFIALSALAGTNLSPHPWLPPFGLARVGFVDNTNEFEADAIARAEMPMNPVDLGAILVPEDWLLLGPGQAA